MIWPAVVAGRMACSEPSRVADEGLGLRRPSSYRRPMRSRKPSTHVESVSKACRRCVEALSKEGAAFKCPSLDGWKSLAWPRADRRRSTVLRGSSTLFLTFEGTRDAKVRDRNTRIRVALTNVQAARLWRLLGEQLSEAERRAAD